MTNTLSNTAPLNYYPFFREKNKNIPFGSAHTYIAHTRELTRPPPNRLWGAILLVTSCQSNYSLAHLHFVNVRLDTFLLISQD